MQDAFPDENIDIKAKLSSMRNKESGALGSLRQKKKEQNVLKDEKITVKT